jgi:YceI-like domain
MSITAVEIPGYVAGTFTVDPGHSDVAFTVRHLMVGKVGGHVTGFRGERTLAPDPLASMVTATIELASIDTNNPQHGSDLRSANFFETDTYPTMTLRSVGIGHGEDGLDVDGELSLHGVTRPGRPGPGRQRLDPRPLRRHPGRLLGHHRAGPGRLRLTTNIPMDGGGWSSATVSRSSSRSKPS